MAKDSKVTGSMIAGRRPARYGDYWVGQQDYEVGPGMQHAPLKGDVSAHADRVKTRGHQRLAELNAQVAEGRPDETPQN